ncbi:hypothetical protein [Arthrobacter sp. QXT-31]|uniref:hypothetical protein n=1 Tax=Arthrobacter sp. QXT-31 TaxID=1357915 RepID=UPI001F262C69|nr:hypothetical protein [Arthrobacter sp. QXT-31]
MTTPRLLRGPYRERFRFQPVGIFILNQDLSKEISMTLDIESSTVVGVAHPLDPLSREEISRAVGILKAGPAAAESFRFISVELREPSKADLRNGVQVVREADAVLVDRAVARSYEAVVNLETGTVDAWKQLAENVQPPFMLDEFAECEEACRKDPNVIAAGQAGPDGPGPGLLRAVERGVFR